MFKRLTQFLKSTVLFIPLLTVSPQLMAGDLGDVVVDPNYKTTPIIVRSTAEFQGLAQTMFSSHGAFTVVGAGADYVIQLSPLTSNQAKVDLSKNGTSILSRVVSGDSMRNAIMRAGDAAVEALTKRPGFFASKLAFIGERSGQTEVCTSDLYAGNVLTITQDRALALSPRWSPDGGQILYTTYYRSGAPDIYSLDLKAGRRNPFITFKGTNNGARFSPDGRRVAMVLSGDGNPELYLTDAQHTSVKRLTRSSSVESSPCFSPDGSKLVFTSDVAGGPQLYLMSLANPGKVDRLATNISRYCAEPDWSLGDPNKIAFTIRIGKGFQIAVYDMSTRKAARQVSNAPYDAVEPAWLEDGRHLIYTARSANKRSLWILDTVSGKSTRITPEAMGNCSQASVLNP